MKAGEGHDSNVAAIEYVLCFKYFDMSVLTVRYMNYGGYKFKSNILCSCMH